MSASLRLCKRSGLLRAGSTYVIYNLRETEKQTETDRQRQTKTEGDRDIETETKRQRETQREPNREKERDRERLRQFRCKPWVSRSKRTKRRPPGRQMIL